MKKELATVEDKLKAARLVSSMEYSVIEVAKIMGVHWSTVYRWIKELRKASR